MFLSVRDMSVAVRWVAMKDGLFQKGLFTITGVVPQLESRRCDGAETQ